MNCFTKMRSTVKSFLHTRGGMRIGMLLLLALFALSFHPLFYVIHSAISMLQLALIIGGGYALGVGWGLGFAVLVHLVSTPLWAREYGFNWLEVIPGLAIYPIAAYVAALVRKLVDRFRSQAATLLQANRDLTSARTQLMQAEKLALFGEIASGVAHEINQPLAIISLSAELAQDQLQRGGTGQAADPMAKILDQVERIGKVISRLKSGTRSELGEELRECHVNDIVRETLDQFEVPLRLYGVQMDVDLAQDLPPVHVLPGQIGQVLAHIMINARDAMEASETKRIAISTRLGASGTVVIEVADSGPGIAPAVMPSIFDPFFTTKEIGKGSGLGLAISFRIVHEHGGKIEVASPPGKGARFTVSLPAAARAARMAGASA
jgi:signal transduction histidine kinase